MRIAQSYWHHASEEILAAKSAGHRDALQLLQFYELVGSSVG